MKKEINLNKGVLFLSDFQNGKSQNIEIKVGRKILMCDIDKCDIGVFLEVYDKKANERNSYSKYDSNLHFVNIKNVNKIIDKDFIEHIDEIENAQNIISKYL